MPVPVDEPNPATGATRIAIELSTVWIEAADNSRQRAAEHIAHLLDEEREDARSMIVGLLNLSEFALLFLAKERGATAENLRQKALEILQEWSPQLPE